LGADVNMNNFKPSSVRLMDQVREVSRYYHYRPFWTPSDWNQI